MINDWTFILSIVSAILTLIAFALSLFSIIEVIAMKRSTHRIQYEPVDGTGMTGADMTKFFDDEVRDIERDQL